MLQMKLNGSIIGLLVFLASSLSSLARPNILFVIADDMSHTSAYGYQFVQTPNFDSLADQGLRFERMYTPSSKCSPSRAVIVTGRNPWQLEEAGNHWPVWPPKFKSVIESLGDNGYFTGFTGKGWGPGIQPKGRSLTGIEYNQIKVKQAPTKSVAKFDYTANFKAFLDDRPENEPFFFWYGCKEPHRGYEFKSGVKAGKRLEDLDFLPSFWGNSENVKHDILDYAIEVEYFDKHLGQILEHLKEAGELDNTLIIATSDNSMPFPRFKGHPHEFATRVPFVVKWPGHIVDPGRVCPEFASFIDLAPTLLEAAGIPTDKAGMQPIQGRGLNDFFTNKVSDRDHVLTGRERNDICRQNVWGYPVRSYHQGDFVYMHNFEPDRWPCGDPEAGYRDTDGSPTKSDLMFNMPDSKGFEYCFGMRPAEELYNITKDPECLTNLAFNPEYADKKEKLKTQLFAKLTSQKDPRMGDNPATFDEYPSVRSHQYDMLVKQKKASDKKRLKKP